MPTDFKAIDHLNDGLNDKSSIRVATTLPAATQENITSLLALLADTGFNNETASEQKPIIIKNIVDGRGLACPMPLLKTKVALRNVSVGESLYVVATDPNSRADIQAFCQHTQKTTVADTLSLILNQQTSQGSSIASDIIDSETSSKDTATPTLDTIFHFIITKTDST